MKRAVVLLTICLIAVLGHAQSLSLSLAGVELSNDTLYLIGNTQDVLLEAHVTVNNLTDKEIEVKAKKTELLTLAETENSFCWGVCFPPFVFEAIESIKIGANGSDTDSFIGDYTHSGIEGTSILRYTFFSTSNSSDSVSLVVFYQVGAAGVRDWTLDANLFKAYPNPTSGQLTLDFPGATNQLINLKIFAITGQILEERHINYGQNSEKIDLSRYPDGVLFLQITNQDGKSALKKIHKSF